MDDTNTLLVVAAKLVSAKAATLVCGIISALLALNIWFVSRLVASVDQTQAIVQKQEIAIAVISSRLEEIESSLKRQRRNS